MRVLVVGCGYVGLPLAAELARGGHEVYGLRRSTDVAGEMKAAGIYPLTADITRPDELALLPARFDWVVHCVGSRGSDAESYRRVYLQGTRNLTEWLAPEPPRKFVYTSSTSVYGQNDGSLVSETSPTEPTAETARILVETENLLREASQRNELPAVILRVAGIYGPGRIHWIRQYLQSEVRIEGKGDRILNMIHRDDVVGCIIAALEKGRPGELYNAVDAEPVSQLELFKWLATRLGRPLPPLAPEVPDARRPRGVTNKRVSNRKLAEELDYPFKYPNFRKGYAAELKRLEARGEVRIQS